MTKYQSPPEIWTPFSDVARLSKGKKGPKLGPPPPGGIAADARNLTGVTGTAKPSKGKKGIATTGSHPIAPRI